MENLVAVVSCICTMIDNYHWSRPVSYRSVDVVLVGTYLISGIDLQSVPQEILVSCAKDSLAVAEKVLDAAPYTSTAENYPTAVALLARNILAERLPEALALARASVSLNEGNLTV